MISVSSLLSSSQRQSFVISSTAFLASLLLLALLSILLLILVRGGAYFWPTPVHELTFYDPILNKQKTVYAQHRQRTDSSGEKVWQVDYSDETAPYGAKTLVEESDIILKTLAAESAQINITDGRTVLAKPEKLTSAESSDIPVSDYEVMQEKVSALSAKIEDIRESWLSVIHQKLAELDIRNVDADAPARLRLNEAFTKWQSEIIRLENRRDAFQMEVIFASGARWQLPLSEIDSFHYVSRQSLWDKWAMALSSLGTFLTDSPKQANTSGGVFPALFGTVLMVFLMTIIVTPFGVLAAVYLSEYAPDNGLTAAIRVSVSNMAGVPSIVYGVFGLGFFVYTLGGSLDDLFFTDRLPSPTMGTPGVFWAALTMAILTLPVVIVATEEGLRRVPDGLKAGSYALGATKAETVLHTILPIASPGIMTGVILAIARAAGEVAPLMLVGAVKFAPNLPIDGEFPYLHLDRQFMHLGVLIYDGAFHSQTDAKGSSMMFAACLLLLVVVFVLNILAVILRTRLRKRYLL
ncbi:phosphate ABC transporter permease PstA [Alteromonas sp. H39]|uniref:phosphate ABC transporter permease PstA n=1 Tax=Alteromonas sp. H39 TaxID=3389876 RepID=UPI0039E10384